MSSGMSRMDLLRGATPNEVASFIISETKFPCRRCSITSTESDCPFKYECSNNKFCRDNIILYLNRRYALVEHF